MRKPLYPTPIEVLETVTKIIRLTGNQWSNWASVAKSAEALRNLSAYLQMGCPSINCTGGFDTSTVTNGEKIARLILGDDYISPRAVMKACGLPYEGDQKSALSVIVPNREKLLQLWVEQRGLIATPPTVCNVIQLREFDNPVFCRKGDIWFTKPRHRFSREDVMQPAQWLAFSKGPYPHSMNLSWEEQQNLLPEDEYIPNVAEVVHIANTYFKVRGVDLFKEFPVRTSSVCEGGGQVVVGGIGPDGPAVRDSWNDGPRERLGVLSVLKLNLESSSVRNIG